MLRISYKNYSYYVNGKKIDDNLCEKIGWYLIEKKDYLEEIVRLYTEVLGRYETESKLKERRERNLKLMWNDIVKLIKLKDKFILVSLNTNRILSKANKNFNKNVLKLVRKD